MTESKRPQVGTIAWRDLTVKDADRVKDFYADVVGWNVEAVAMGEYSDYCMVPAEGKLPEVGVCHARGVNADLPAQWLMYVVVADLEASLARCKELGGEQLTKARGSGEGRFAVIKDPAGAVCALYQAGGG